MDDFDTFGSGFFHEVNAIGEHIGGIHDRLDGFMQLTPLSGEFILELDENYSCSAGIQGRARESICLRSQG